MMYKPLFILLLLRCTNTQLPSPENITRTVDETNVFIPCPHEFSTSPVIWRINETDYSSYTLPSVYLLTPGGIFIRRVTHCFDQTSFQCIDTSNDGIIGLGSSVGVLTVMPPGPCEMLLEDILGSCLTNTSMEIKHNETEYGSFNITLAWQILNSTCSTSQLMSHLQCDADNSDRAYNLLTNDTRATIPSENVQTSAGSLAYFNLTSLDDLMESETVCPNVLDSLRFNVTETEVVTVLLSNDYCSCIELPCDERGQGILSVAISNPYAGQKDFICNAQLSNSDPRTEGVPCYSSSRCLEIKNFQSCNDYPSFFRICEYPDDNTRCSVCFQNVNELNGTRLDFFWYQRNICTGQGFYHNRLYFKSILLKSTNASSNISVNETSKEICFSSISRDCNLTYDTRYNFSITDITGNVIFRNESIPELTCTKINSPLLPRCGPYLISAQPINDNIMYNPVRKQIYGTGNPTISDVCSCLNETVDLQLSAPDPNEQSSSFELEYSCSSMYLTPINISINISNGMQYTVQCKNGSISISDFDCGTTINICGYGIFTSGSVTCMLPPCIQFVSERCPTSPTPSPSPTPDPIPIVVGVLLAVASIIMISALMFIIIMVRYIYKWKRSRNQQSVQFSTADERVEEKQDDDIKKNK